MAEIIGWFEKTVMSVKTLTADPDFDSVTEPEEYEVIKKSPPQPESPDVYIQGNFDIVCVYVFFHVCLLTFRNWNINMWMAPVWNPSQRMMATFKVSSKTSRSVFTLHSFLSLEVVLCLYITAYVWA